MSFCYFLGISFSHFCCISGGKSISLSSCVSSRDLSCCYLLPKCIVSSKWPKFGPNIGQYYFYFSCLRWVVGGSIKNPPLFMMQDYAKRVDTALLPPAIRLLYCPMLLFSTRRRQKVCNDFSWMLYLLPAICVRRFYVQARSSQLLISPPPFGHLLFAHFHLNSGQEEGYPGSGGGGGVGGGCVPLAWPQMLMRLFSKITEHKI